MTLQTVVSISIVMILLDLFLLSRSFYEKKRYYDVLNGCYIASAVVIGAYIVSICVSDYFWMSFFSSVYFSAIDFALFYVVLYIVCVTTTKRNKIHHGFMALLTTWQFIDVIILMINPFKEIAISYSYVKNSIAHWRFEPHALYNSHLVLSYSMISIIVINLIYRIVMSPRAYRRRYSLILGGMLFVVAMNALFLFIPNNTMFDFSVLFYSLICGLFFWVNNHYSEKGMLAEVRELVLDELGHSVILFDNENYFAMCNVSANELITLKGREKTLHIKDFIEQNRLGEFIPNLDENYSFQWTRENDEKSKIYRCDFSVLKDNKNRVIGRMFMFSDYTLEYDLLTTFNSEANFRARFVDKLDEKKSPAGVAICDINCLSVINSKMGKDEGDRALKYLADAIKECTPEGSYYARLNDAILMFVCFKTDIASMRRYIAAIKGRLAEADDFCIELNMQSAIGMAGSQGPTIIDAVNAATKSMKARKMMDATSAHSSLLDSIAEILQQSDSCTTEHVRRTQIMGEKLGLRLGLSDVDISNLELLCLLHDIGKLGIPLEILNKPGKLNDAEWEVMRSHAEKGYKIAKASRELEDIAELILHHHECWNGSGYPDGLKQEAIPVLSRIIAVVDTFDAMTNDRPYRKALSNAAACEELKRCAGTQFDPFVVSEFIALLKDLKLYDEVRKEDVSLNKTAKFKPGGLVIDESEEVEVEEGGEDCYEVIYTTYILGDENRIISVDDKFEEFTGYTRDDIKEYNLSQRDMIFPEEWNKYNDLCLKLLARSKEAYIEHRIRRKDGTARNAICYGRQYFDSVSRKPRVQIMVADMAASMTVKLLVNEAKESSRRQIERWENGIRRDQMTGLLNRIAFQNDVQLQLLNGNEQVVMIMSDLDYFKKFNDTQGHKRGDELLICYANSLKKAVGELGIAGRMGGDEFAAMLCFDASYTEAAIREFIVKLWTIVSADTKLCADNVTVSMGAYIRKAEIDNFNDLYKLTDAALYAAKEEGRNRVHIDGE